MFVTQFWASGNVWRCGCSHLCVLSPNSRFSNTSRIPVSSIQNYNFWDLALEKIQTLFLLVLPGVALKKSISSSLATSWCSINSRICCLLFIVFFPPVTSAGLVTGKKNQTDVFNKKVLLRERKRHTACRVASTPYVVLTGYPPPARGPPPGWTWQGTPPPAGPGRVPPPCWLPHGILGNVAKHYGIWVPPPWTDRWMDRHVSKHYLPVVLRTRAVTTHIENEW